MTPLAERLAWARNEGRAHEREYLGHTTTELDTSTHFDAAVTMVCDVCRWTVSAGGPREDATKHAADVTELTEWLLARIAEDQAVATAAGGGHLSAYLEGGDDGWAVESDPYIQIDGVDVSAILGGEPLARLLERFDPTRVLAECEAKRRIIELHGWVHGDTPVERSLRFCEDDLNPWPCPTLRLLALPYADRDGYRDEWRP